MDNEIVIMDANKSRIRHAFVYIMVSVAVNFKSELKTINGGYGLELWEKYLLWLVNFAHDCQLFRQIS